MIAQLEAVARSAWPARSERDYDGWLLCLGGGRTRRTNSVQPVTAGRLPLDEKIAHCEAYYRDAGARPVFKLTAAAEPADLEGALAGRGYRLSDPTSVQCVELASLDGVLRAAVGQEALRIEPGLTAGWLADCARLSGMDDGGAHALAEVLERISLHAEPCAFASQAGAEETIAQGLGVVRGEYLYLAQVVTAADVSQRGHAQGVVLQLCDWARGVGATRALLQVVAANAAAMALYLGLGFEEAYRYWYREGPDEGENDQTSGAR